MAEAKRILSIKGIAFFIGLGFIILWFWQMLFAFLVLSVLVILAYGFIGQKTGTTTLVVSILLLGTAQMHWVNGNTVCLDDPTHPYLWQMQRIDVDQASGSITTEDDGAISISFSAKSEDNIPGSQFAEVIVGNNVQISPLQFESVVQLPKDIRIIDNIDIPATLNGLSLFVPQDAQFRANRPFESTDNLLSVADLPVLTQIDEMTYTPLGILTGEIRLGETAALTPAMFDGRNLVLDGNRRDSPTETNRQYFRDKISAPENIVYRMQRGWLLLNQPSHLYLHKYAEAYDCRPAAYEQLGIGWLFRSNL